MQVCLHWHTQTLSPYLTASVLAAASLELKAESARSCAPAGGPTSVAFSPDGTAIVSRGGIFVQRGGYRLDGPGTIKVWDAGAFAQKSPFVTFSALTLLGLLADTLNLKGVISDTGMAQVSSVSFSPDGSRIVGGGPSSDYASGTIKVWDAGVFWAPNAIFWPELTPYSHAWQPH